MHGCLYNVVEDPEERDDLSRVEPRVLIEMHKKLAKYQATYFNPDRGSKSPEACAAALGKYEGFWGPFLP